MSKRQRRKMRREQKVEPAPTPQATVTPIRMVEAKPSPKPKFNFGAILPYELGVLAPLIIDFYKAINFIEGVQNPRPLINELCKEMMQNPLSIVYVCYDQQFRPHGYIWFRVDRNVWGQNYITIEHDYIIPEHRHTLREARIHRMFINYMIKIGEQFNTQYVNTSVRSRTLELSRHKLGFKSVEVKMTFRGTAQDFRNQNPSFQEYKKYEENKLAGEV